MKGFHLVFFCLSSLTVFSGNFTSTAYDTIFHDDFTQVSSWLSQGNGQVNVSNGKCNFESVYCGEYNRIYSFVDEILPMDYWKAECAFSILEQNPDGFGTGEVVMALTAGPLDFMSYDIQQYYEETYQDGIAVVLLSNGSSDNNIDNWYFLIEGKKGNYRTFDLSSVIYADSGIDTYYLSLERTSASSVQLSIFSDAARTRHLPGSPVSFIIDPTIEGLHTVQHGTITPGYYPRRITACIDDDYIFNKVVYESYEISIYPNPANDLISVKQDDEPGVWGTVEYSIFNMLGMKLLTGSQPISFPFNINCLAEGAFILVIKGAQKQFRAKFIKHY